MSVLTTRTSILSILKVNVDNKPSPRRVRFQLPNNIRKIFLDKINKTNTRDYDDLVCTIRDTELTDENLLNLLNEAKSCVGLLDYELRLFVQALVILGWAHRSEHVVNIYQEFILNLVSAHPAHCKYVIEQFVKLFASSETNSALAVTNLHFAKIHKILKSITKTIPLTSEILISSIKTNFPFYSMCHYKQQSYMQNVLKVVEYLPSCRGEILLLFVDRLITLDVNAKFDDINEPNEEQFGMDDIGNPIIESLDYGMELLFRYFDSVCRNSNGEIQWIETKHLFSDLLIVLDKCLLNSYGSYNVQFLLFYFVSFKPTLVQAFLNALWEKVLSLNAPPIVRTMSVAYIASFLARANFIPNGFLKTYLSEMSSWAHRYIYNQDSVTKPNREPKAHSVFYGVCQAIFYVIAFRHRDLVDSRKKLVFLESLNLSKIVICSLNPLLVCTPEVIANFAAVARDHQLVYCYTIIEKNDRGFLDKPTADDFFPFDPYLLKRSSSFITPLYRHYKSEVNTEVATEAEDEKGMDVEDPVKNVDDDDDFIADSQSPDKNQHQLYNFSYSTSPGFRKASV